MDSTEFYRQEEMKAHRKCDELSAEIESLRQQLAAALAACEQRAKALRWYMPMMPIEHQYRINDILAIKPDASALKARDEALIERCAEVCEGLKMWPTEKVVADDCAVAIRELKGTLYRAREIRS